MVKSLKKARNLKEILAKTVFFKFAPERLSTVLVPKKWAYFDQRLECAERTQTLFEIYNDPSFLGLIKKKIIRPGDEQISYDPKLTAMLNNKELRGSLKESLVSCYDILSDHFKTFLSTSCPIQPSYPRESQFLKKCFPSNNFQFNVFDSPINIQFHQNNQLKLK